MTSSSFARGLAVYAFAHHDEKSAQRYFKLSRALQGLAAPTSSNFQAIYELYLSGQSRREFIHLPDWDMTTAEYAKAAHSVLSEKLENASRETPDHYAVQKLNDQIMKSAFAMDGYSQDLSEILPNEEQLFALLVTQSQKRRIVRFATLEGLVTINFFQQKSGQYWNVTIDLYENDIGDPDEGGEDDWSIIAISPSQESMKVILDAIRDPKETILAQNQYTFP